MQRRHWIELIGFIGLILLWSAFAMPARAQNSPPPDVIITPEEAARLLLNAVNAILIGAFGNAPITLFLVSVIKRFIPAEYSAGIIQFLVGLTLTAIYWIAQYAGYETQFNSAVDFVLLAGPGLLTLIATLTASSAYYVAARTQHVPVIGYQRE